MGRLLRSPAMVQPVAWWVLRRDIAPSVEVQEEPTVFATLVMDSEGAVAGVHVAGDAAQSLRLALRRAARRSHTELPALVLCPPGLGGELGETLSLLAIDAHASEEDPPDGLLDVFDAMVGHMAGRRQASEPPSPDEWRMLHAQALRYLDLRPWERWPTERDIPLRIDLDGSILELYAMLMPGGGARQIVAVSPTAGTASSPAPPPGNAVLTLADEEIPHELVMRSERYGWPASSRTRPVFLTCDEEGPREIDAWHARALTAVLAALLERDERDPPQRTSKRTLRGG